MKKPITRSRVAQRAKAKAAKRTYKMKRRQQKYDYNTNLQSMKGKTARHNIAWGAATIINDRQARAQENVAKAKSNQSYRFGADIVKRTDTDVQPEDQVLGWIK